MILDDSAVREAVDQAVESLDEVGAVDRHDALTRLRDECQRRLLAMPTPRELDVIRLIAEGKSTRECAERLGIATKTADVHRVNLMRKLGLHNAADVTRYAIRQGIVNASI